MIFLKFIEITSMCVFKKKIHNEYIFLLNKITSFWGCELMSNLENIFIRIIWKSTYEYRFDLLTINEN